MRRIPILIALLALAGCGLFPEPPEPDDGPGLEAEEMTDEAPEGGVEDGQGSPDETYLGEDAEQDLTRHPAAEGDEGPGSGGTQVPPDR